MKTAKAKCGCRYELGDRERWVELCPKHEAEFNEIHTRWAAEHRAARPETKEPRHG